MTSITMEGRMSTVTAKQIKRYICDTQVSYGGHDGELHLAEVDGVLWATNRVWLTRAKHLEPFLDKHEITGAGAYVIDSPLVTAVPDPKLPDLAKIVARLLDLADYTVPLIPASIGGWGRSTRSPAPW